MYEYVLMYKGKVIDTMTVDFSQGVIHVRQLWQQKYSDEVMYERDELFFAVMVQNDGRLFK